MFFGALADYVGRRLIYMSCLAILSLSCVGLALCPTDAYWLLMVLRCFQAAGSTSTIALGWLIVFQANNHKSFTISYQVPVLSEILQNHLNVVVSWEPIWLDLW
jgi:MFS family permease